MTRSSKTRPAYERSGVLRAQVEKDYPHFVKVGYVPSAAQDGRLIRSNLSTIGFHLQPKDGWDRIGYEFRIIELSMLGLWPEEKGNAELARECLNLARQIHRATKSVGDLSRWQAFNVASLFTKSNPAEYLADLATTAHRLKLVGAYLAESKQPAKWATTMKREARLALASKLAPVFEQQFRLPAKPRGGSEAFDDIRSENEWTKFFQSIIAFLFGEEITPDRQNILWEASRLSEIPS